MKKVGLTIKEKNFLRADKVAIVTEDNEMYFTLDVRQTPDCIKGDAIQTDKFINLFYKQEYLRIPFNVSTNNLQFNLTITMNVIQYFVVTII